MTSAFGVSAGLYLDPFKVNFSLCAAREKKSFFLIVQIEFPSKKSDSHAVAASVDGHTSCIGSWDARSTACPAVGCGPAQLAG